MNFMPMDGASPFSGGTFRELGDVPVDEIQQGGIFEELRYKSVDIIGYNFHATHFEQSFNAKHYSAPSPKGLASVPMKELMETPVYLVPTHVKTTRSVEEIEQCITLFLSSYPQLSFEADEVFYKWDAVNVSGSSMCKLEIHVYQDEMDSGLYIIEVNRLKGNSDIFHRLFKDISGKFEELEVEAPSMDSFSSCMPIDCVDDIISDHLAPQALAPLKNMANMPNVDILEEAAKILCDLSFHEGYQGILCENDFIKVLVNLLNVDNEIVKLNAVFALTKLSESPVYQSEIINEGVIPILISNTRDGPFSQAELRRSCACLLANLSSKISDEVAQADITSLTQWVNNVDQISDLQLKVHAIRVRSNLLQYL